MGTSAIAVLLLLSSPLTLRGGAQVNDFDTLSKQGWNAFAANDLTSARRFFDGACPAEILQSTAFPKIALCEHALGIVDYAGHRIDQAESHFLRALSAWDKAGAAFVGNHAATAISLGRVYLADRRFEDARRVLTLGLDLARAQNDNPSLVAVALSRLGGLDSETGELEQGGALLKEAIAKLRALATPKPAELAYALSSLGLIELGAGSYAAGESTLREAVSTAAKATGDDSPETAAYQTNLGLAFLLEGRCSRALPLLNRAGFIFETKLGANSYQFGVNLAELAAVEANLGKFALAERDAARAIPIFSRQFPADAMPTILAEVNLATIYLSEHKTSEAEKILPDAVAAERLQPGANRTLADGLRRLAQLRAQQRQWSEAESLYREALATYEAIPGPVAPDIESIRREYARVLKHDHGKPV